MKTENNIALNETREVVREKYGEIAKQALRGAKSCCGSGGSDAITCGHYDADYAADVPSGALNASLGCGNPIALAELKLGETVLDLGSGGGIDVLLSAKRVGPTGFAYGVDMTDEMLELAEENRKKAGAENVKFLKGNIEEIPLPDNSIDVLISNCVINLSGDKSKVINEAFRVLKPGGRFAVSDVVVNAPLPEQIRKDMESWVGCVAGALEKDEYISLLTKAGFLNASIETTREYQVGQCCSPAVDELSDTEKSDLDGRIISGFVRATKPL